MTSTPTNVDTAFLVPFASKKDLAPLFAFLNASFKSYLPKTGDACSRILYCNMRQPVIYIIIVN